MPAKGRRLEMMDYQSLWFFLWAVLWAAYFFLDGFDLGVGILHPFLARNDLEKRLVMNSIGPVWDGNKVWLVTAAGVTFAAFPAAFVVIFSAFYFPLLLILFGLIIRGIALEFRNKSESRAWRRGWDLAFFLGSLTPAFLFGVIFGNLFQGLPLNDQGYQGSAASLCNRYSLMTGLMFVVMLTVHGAHWVAVKTGDDLVGARLGRFAPRAWVLLVVTVALFFVNTAFATSLFANYLDNYVLLVLPAGVLLSLLAMGMEVLKRNYRPAFFASGAAVVLIVLTGFAGLYPLLVPARPDAIHSLTIFNSAASAYTLKILTVVAVVFVPLVAAYQIWVYRIFRGPVTGEDMENKEAY